MKRILNGIAAVILGLSAAGLTSEAGATAGPRGAVSVEVVSDCRGSLTGIPVREIVKNGTCVTKQYIEAQRGENYGIVIRNNTSGRVGVVIAVDGRNIIDGRQSDLRNREAMYVVNGHETARYDGWRTSKDEIHRFYFTDTPDSYSVKTFSDASALGVIAVAVYREKGQQHVRQKPQVQTPSPAPQAGAPLKDEKRVLAEESAATGFGDSNYSPVVTVEFQPENRPFQKSLLKYEWREMLCKKGILECGQEKNRLWDSEDYAPYPPGYPRV